MSGEDQRQPPFGSPLDQARFIAAINAEGEALRASVAASQATPPANPPQGTELNTLRSEPQPHRSVLQ
jgi:hypothetical protein